MQDANAQEADLTGPLLQGPAYPLDLRGTLRLTRHARLLTGGGSFTPASYGAPIDFVIGRITSAANVAIFLGACPVI